MSTDEGRRLLAVPCSLLSAGKAEKSRRNQCECRKELLVRLRSSTCSANRLRASAKLAAGFILAKEEEEDDVDDQLNDIYNDWQLIVFAHLLGGLIG